MGQNSVDVVTGASFRRALSVGCDACARIGYAVWAKARTDSMIRHIRCHELDHPKVRGDCARAAESLCLETCRGCPIRGQRSAAMAERLIATALTPSAQMDRKA